jgi:hypothetical protein
MVGYFKGAALIALSAAAPLCFSYYVAPSVSKSSRLSNNGGSGPTFLLSNLIPRALRHDLSTTTPSALSMGFMEDFVTGRDDETRKAANAKYIEQ